jgi:tripartite-type tricarboxylate transporter receptor subunit TctC
VVPFPPGGPTDVVARILAQKLTQSWGQQTIVENRPGGNTIIGADAVAKAAPDGQTLLLAIDSTLAMNPSLYARLPYDPLKDFAPITRVGTGSLLLVVNAATGPRSVKELIQQAKASPGKLTFGAGTVTLQLAGEMFKIMAGVDMVFVPYKGSAPVVQGLLAGDVNAIFDGVAASLPHIRSGRFRVLATLGTKPIAALPDVPTLAEASGLSGYNAATWNGLVAPAGTPADIIGKLHDEFVRILASSDVRERMLAVGYTPVTSSPAEFGAFIAEESTRWSKVIKSVGIKMD